MKDDNPYRWFGGNAARPRARQAASANHWLVLIGLAYPAFAFAILALAVIVRLTTPARIPSYSPYLPFVYCLPGVIIIATAGLRLMGTSFDRYALLALAGWVLVIDWFFRTLIHAVWATM